MHGSKNHIGFDIYNEEIEEPADPSALVGSYIAPLISQIINLLGQLSTQIGSYPAPKPEFSEFNDPTTTAIIIN